MPRPYSVDLRERAVSRVMVGETVRSVAAVLQVSVASVVKWSQLFRRTGSVAPGPMHGHRPRLLLAHRDWLMARTANDQPFTLRGLRSELIKQRRKVSRELECAPRGGQNRRFELTPLAGLLKNGSHDETPVAQRCIQTASC